SNNLASLKPGVDRLTLTADLLINSSGVVIQSKLYPSVIRSAERMTYTKVWDILQGDRKLTEKYGHLVEMFRNMLTLRNRLFQRREKRGSLIFELPEPYVLMDNNGVPVDIQRRNRNPAHMIIEEFMLAANEAVAVFLEKAGIPLLFRNHEPPNVSDMRELQRFLGRFGYSLRLNGKANPLDIQSILNKCRGKPEEFIMNTVILRSMKQARYSPKNTGHFGLASGSYCHFTSPIRRYPDLIVHRILKSYLSGLLTKEKINKLRDELEYIGELSSERERVANEAEREIVDRLSARFMMDKIGEEYDGRITMVKEFGIFVELLNHFVEGMIPVEALTDDHYRYDENSFILRGMRRKSVFKIGEKIKVKVSRVNLDYGKIEFLPADLTGSLRKTKRT
ncbi:MAG TPA: VacB/RNase II family 3'-5' exoribonuclease, partial [bacterium]